MGTFYFLKSKRWRQTRHLLIFSTCLLSINLTANVATNGQGFSVIAQAQAFANRPSFSTDELINARVSLNTRVDRLWAVGVQYQLSKAFSARILFNTLNFGTSVKLLNDYPRYKYESNVIGSRNTNAIGGALLVQYALPSSTPTKHWLIQVGADVMHRPIGMSNYVCGIKPPNGLGPNLIAGFATLNLVDGQANRWGIRAGIGREWQLGKRHFVEVSGVGSLGLQTFEEFCLEYELPDSNTGQQKFYHNNLRNRLSYYGLEVGYRFALKL